MEHWGLSHNIFKLGVLLINKDCLYIRLQKQLWDGTSMTWRMTSCTQEWIVMVNLAIIKI
jgi:hypothetical protein